MYWIEEAKNIFKIVKPEHFTDYRHCEECAEHDETLLKSNIETIGLDELGNPGWDPICFCSEEGIKYYMPALIRLSLETLANDFYFGQFLFHLEYDGKNNKLLQSCSIEQRKFIADFIDHMIVNHAETIDENLCSDDVLRVSELWNDT